MTVSLPCSCLLSLPQYVLVPQDSPETTHFRDHTTSKWQETRQSGEKQLGLSPVPLELRHHWTEKAHLPPSSGAWRSPTLSSRHRPPRKIPHERTGKNEIAPPTLCQSFRSVPLHPSSQKQRVSPLPHSKGALPPFGLL